jgi:hypothetical protein
MTVICCSTCRADPIGRWKQPPAMIFAEGKDDDRHYFCRDHLPAKKKEQIETRERDLGWPPGGLR